jgi:hypothetical protein
MLMTSGHRSLERGLDQSVPHSSQKEPALLTLWFWTSASRTVRQYLLFKKLCYGNLGGLTRRESGIVAQRIGLVLAATSYLCNLGQIMSISLSLSFMNWAMEK